MLLAHIKTPPSIKFVPFPIIKRTSKFPCLYFSHQKLFLIQWLVPNHFIILCFIKYVIVANPLSHIKIAQCLMSAPSQPKSRYFHLKPVTWSLIQWFSNFSLHDNHLGVWKHTVAWELCQRYWLSGSWMDPDGAQVCALKVILCYTLRSPMSQWESKVVA